MEIHSRFVAHLDGLQAEKNLQALAVFRRSLSQSPGTDLAPYRYFRGFLGEQEDRSWEDLLCLTAGLYSMSPVKRQPETLCSFGKTLAAACTGNPGALSGVERRLVALLNCHRDDLPEHLRHLVTMTKRAGEAIDWITLMQDLRAWNREGRSVQRRWARDFWGALPAEEKAGENDLPTGKETEEPQ